MKKALLVGINYTKKGGGTGNNELRGCVNDVTKFYKILIGKYKWDPKDIKILTDDSNEKPFKKNIEDGMMDLVKGCSLGDTLVFMNSSHGSNVPDRDGDEKDGKDEVLVPIDYESKGIIKDDWILDNVVSKVVKGATLWGFIDACHSGSMFDLKYTYRYAGSKKNNIWNDAFSFSLEKEREMKGCVYMLSGCLDSQTSADAFLLNKNTGAMSFCLQECLEKADCNISFHELLKQVTILLKEHKFDQTPQLDLSIQGDITSKFCL